MVTDCSHCIQFSYFRPLTVNRLELILLKILSICASPDRLLSEQPQKIVTLYIMNFRVNLLCVEQNIIRLVCQLFDSKYYVTCLMLVHIVVFSFSAFIPIFRIKVSSANVTVLPLLNF